MGEGVGVDICIDENLNVAFLTVSGEIVPRTVTSALEELLRSDGFNRNMNSMIDLCNAQFSLETSDILRVGDLFLSKQIERGNSFRMAFLCDDDFTFGICRMIAVELEQVSIWAKVVRDREDALAWVCDGKDHSSDLEIE